MCEYCQTLPHKPGCPNYPEAEPVYYCIQCDEGILKDYDYAININGEYLCLDCLSYMPIHNLLKEFGIDLLKA